MTDGIEAARTDQEAMADDGLVLVPDQAKVTIGRSDIAVALLGLGAVLLLLVIFVV